MPSFLRFSSMPLAVFCFLALGLGAADKAAAQVEISTCSPEVRAVLASIGVPYLDVVKSTTGDLRRDRRGGSYRVGYQVWLELADKPGKLVIEFDLRCQMKQRYTRGGLELPGVEAY
ncbi:hypothetical protein ACTL6U_08400 [Rhodovibrionaceae bacterium A322]